MAEQAHRVLLLHTRRHLFAQYLNEVYPSLKN
jgi:hypothetical protein